MQDQAPPPGVIEYLLLALGTLGAWLTGETGRVMLAGGAGGMARWLFEPRLRLVDGLVFVISGLIGAAYVAPAALYFAAHYWPMIAGMPSAHTTTGFLIGAFGVGLGKIVVAVIAARGKAIVKEQTDDKS